MGWRNSFKKLMSRPRSESSSAQLELIEYRFLKKTRFRIVVMGGAEVGKTCLVSRLLYEKFLQEYKATVEEMHIGLFEMNGLPITLDILDTSGSLEFPAMRRLSISTGDAFILVYSVDKPASFREVERLRKEILDEKAETMTRVPIVIVANKVDLELDMESTARRRSRAASEILEGRKKERVKSRASSATLETGWFKKRADLIEDVRPNFAGFLANLNKNSPDLIEGVKKRADLIEGVKKRADIIEGRKPSFAGFAALDSRYFSNLYKIKATEKKAELFTTVNSSHPAQRSPLEKVSKNSLNIYDQDVQKIQIFDKFNFKSEKNLNLINANKSMNRSMNLFNAKMRLNSLILNKEDEEMLRMLKGESLELLKMGKTEEENENLEKALRLEELQLEAKNLNAKKVQRALTESLVTLDWGHGYVEISAKEDDDITTVIFKELLAQVDLQLKEDVKCVEKMPSRHFSLKTRKPSRFARRRSSCKVS